MHLKKRWLDRRVYEYFAVNVAPYLGWRDPILVYQMGKVGSSSIRNSLFRCPDPRTRLVLMSHEFFPIRNRELARIQIEPKYWPYVQQEYDISQQAFRRLSPEKQRQWRRRERFYSEQIYRSYVKRGDRLRVISPIRDPVANNISMFFEVFDNYTGHPFDESTLSVPEMIDVFINSYVHGRPLVWFDAELKTTLGVDVYQHPFPVDKGYAIIREKQVELLIFQCELPDAVKAQAISEFLGIEQFALVRSNVSSQRSHADAYAQFKQQIRIPDQLLADIYDSKFARHFYSEAARTSAKARWSGGK
ncbi:MAG: hypothetical protein KDA92_06900 [Planctomycetales bacterium]|nr:hypothetical protein [Planctomycetales bacterium]